MNASKETMLQRIVAIYKIKQKNDKLSDSSSVMLATRKESQFPTQGSIWRPPNLVSTVVTDLPEEVLLGKTFLNKQCINKA